MRVESLTILFKAGNKEPETSSIHIRIFRHNLRDWWRFNIIYYIK